jgi:DNA polymerase III alpha subunit
VKSGAFHIQKLQPFRSFNDFYKRVNKSRVRTNAMQMLLDSGCFDCFGGDRAEIARWLAVPLKKTKTDDGAIQQTLL